MLNEKRIVILRTILFLLIFMAFVALENVSGIRLIKIVIYMSILLMMPVFRSTKKPWIFNEVFLLIVDATLIFLIGLSSRYVINYYVYALYIILMIEAGLIYELKFSKYVIGIISVFTLYHYAVLYYYRQNLGTISEIFFLILINSVIILGVFFVRYQKEEKENQIKLYHDLDKAHKELVNSNNKLERLTRIEVKNTIAREIHDALGHDMVGLIMEIEMADILINKDKDAAKKMLVQAKVSARNGMKTIRKVVETLRDESESIISETIEEMIGNFSKRLNLNIDVDLDKSIYDYSKKIHDILYRLVQECLTNSLKHGDATHIVIKLKDCYDKITFEISDNGKGNIEINEGFGIKGMRERISMLNGKLIIDGSRGFIVKGYIEVSDD